MVLIWFKKRKRPRIHAAPQEAWLDLLALAEEGLSKVGGVERVQVYATEVDAKWFLDEFFPKDIVENALLAQSRGDPTLLLAIYRGLIMYATFKPKFERFLLLTVGRMLAEGEAPVTKPSGVQDGATGRIVALGTFYGRFPVFVASLKYSQALEEDYRSLGLRRMDTVTRSPFQGYMRWVPVEFGYEGEEGQADPKAWEALPLSRELHREAKYQSWNA